MAYSVRCECGKTHPVSAAHCGTTWACTCGRTITVPSLSQLRAEAGEFSASPEMIIESMLIARELPQESACVECHAPTEGIATFTVICEQVGARRSAEGCSRAVYYVLFLAFLMIGWFVYWRRGPGNAEMVGRSVAFRLPLRLCPVCQRSGLMRDPKALLRRVPVY